MPYKVVTGILTSDQQFELDRLYGSNRRKAPPVVASPTSPVVKPKPKTKSAPSALATTSGARFKWRYFESRDDLNTMTVTGDERPSPESVKMFERLRPRYEKALAALDRVDLKPNAFAIFNRDCLDDELPTGIFAAPDGESFWPRVGDMGYNNGYYPIGFGRFDGSETAEQLALFACRLWEEADGDWFMFVPATWDNLTQEEIDSIIFTRLDKAEGVSVTFPDSEAVV